MNSTACSRAKTFPVKHVGVMTLVPTERTNGGGARIPVATIRPLAASHDHDSLQILVAARRIVMYLVAAVMLGGIVLYLLQQIEDLTN